jgi:hypothetical protein
MSVTSQVVVFVHSTDIKCTVEPFSKTARFLSSPRCRIDDLPVHGSAGKGQEKTGTREGFPVIAES